MKNGEWKYLGKNGYLLGEKIFGDIDDDNDIDGDDVIKLKEFITNIDFTTGKSTIETPISADTNLDGVVNGKDVVRLKKYLANIIPGTGKSTVVLGR